jgi:hypothetical protein
VMITRMFHDPITPSSRRRSVNLAAPAMLGIAARDGLAHDLLAKNLQVFDDRALARAAIER